MVNGLREWAAAARLTDTAPLKHFENRTIAIEAEHYIDRILSDAQTREPLLPALGGLPFTIDNVLREHLAAFEEAKITPLFVFNGIRINTQQIQLQAGLAHSQNVGEAWDLYNASDPERAVAKFGSSCLFRVTHVYRHVQEFFHQSKVDFIVAPYSACAQIASIEGAKYADAVAGSTELMLFHVERVILDFDMTRKQVTWLSRSRCIEELGLFSPEQFVDACLFAGSSFLPTLPPLRDEAMPNAKIPKIRSAAELLLRMGMNGNDLVMHYRDAPAMQMMDYADQYRKALMSLRHNVVISEHGKIEPFRKEACPNDVHSFIGQHLPDEVLFYVSRAILGPRLLVWRTSGEILESPPLDAGVSPVYRTLVQEQLNPDRTQALALLSSNLHRFYQHKNPTLRCWFDMNNVRTLSITDIADPKVMIQGWNMRIDAISQRATALDVSTFTPKHENSSLTQLQRKISSLAFAIESLRDSTFATQTNLPDGATGEKPLKHTDEVRCNALWRYLHLRGYTKQDHTLSDLGECLAASVEKIPKKHPRTAEMTEAVILAVELLRLKRLNADNMFPIPPYHGAPFRGSTTDQKNTLLVSRVACLGRLQHKAIGYTGPLSRHLLAYHSIVSAVRSTQRDLVETTLASMLLTGIVDRTLPTTELQSISFDLPFMKESDSALAIAVKHYLDELSGQQDATSESARGEVKAKGRDSWFPHAIDFEESLKYAFEIWDAVMAAVRIAPTSLMEEKDKKEWIATDEWLSVRR